MDDRRHIRSGRGARSVPGRQLRRLLLVGLPAALAVLAAFGGSALSAGAATARPELSTNSPLVFNFVSVGQTSLPLTARITNSGGGSATISGIAVAGDYPTDFSIVANQCTGAVLKAGDSCTLSVDFHPKEPGTRVADLMISDNRYPCVNYMTLAGSGFTATVPDASTASCQRPGAAATTTSTTTTHTTTTSTTTTHTTSTTTTHTTATSTTTTTRAPATSTATASTGTPTGAPGAGGSTGSVDGLVTSAECTARDAIVVHLQSSAGDSNIAASIYVDGKLAAAVHQRGITNVVVSFRNKPSGRYAIEVVITRVSGKQVRSASPYFVTCGAG